MSDKSVQIGLVGFGTVGTGVAKILLENHDDILDKTGLDLRLKTVVDLDTTSERAVTLPAGVLTDDMNSILKDDSIDIAIELVGGTTVAKQIHLDLLAAGKHVVTANKALLAECGNEIYAAAEKADRCVAFEASCVGGVPIISALRTGLAANRITALYGIMNGTCNYILSSMTDKAEDFATVLRKARDKGYAEADPTLDINGGDTAHKLAILARLAFGCEIDYDSIYIEGIENTSIDDIRYGLEMGYVLKLLAIGIRDDGAISLRVHPCFVPAESLLGQVEGSFNAVSVFGHAVGQTMFYGRGAGMMPTASAVVADLVEIAMGNSQKLFVAQHINPSPKVEPIDNINSRFYIRLMCADEPGVVAHIGRILSEHNISISGLLQHEATKDSNYVPVIITTHATVEKNLKTGLDELTALEEIHGQPVCIRIVDIPRDDLDD